MPAYLKRYNIWCIRVKRKTFFVKALDIDRIGHYICIVTKERKVRNTDQINQAVAAQDMLPNCGVVAVANAVGKSTDKMMETFRQVCKRDRRWLGRTNYAMRRKVLKHLKVKFTEKRASGSLKKFVEWQTARDKKYIVTLGNHIVFVCNGIVHDQHEIKPADEHKFAGKRVKSFIEVAA